MKTQKNFEPQLPIIWSTMDRKIYREEAKATTIHKTLCLYAEEIQENKIKSELWVTYLYHPGPTDKKTPTDKPNPSFLNSTIQISKTQNTKFSSIFSTTKQKVPSSTTQNGQARIPRSVKLIPTLISRPGSLIITRRQQDFV